MTRTARTRIGRVRMKDGGADLKIFHPRRRARTDYVHQELQNGVDAIGRVLASDIAGYVLVAWDFQGWSTVGYFNSNDSPIHDHLMPEFVRDRLLVKVDSDASFDVTFPPEGA